MVKTSPQSYVKWVTNSFLSPQNQTLSTESLNRTQPAFFSPLLINNCIKFNTQSNNMPVRATVSRGALRGSIPTNTNTELPALCFFIQDAFILVHCSVSQPWGNTYPREQISFERAPQCPYEISWVLLCVNKQISLLQNDLYFVLLHQQKKTGNYSSLRLLQPFTSNTRFLWVVEMLQLGQEACSDFQ